MKWYSTPAVQIFKRRTTECSGNVSKNALHQTSIVYPYVCYRTWLITVATCNQFIHDVVSSLPYGLFRIFVFRTYIIIWDEGKGCSRFVHVIVLICTDNQALIRTTKMCFFDTIHRSRQYLNLYDVEASTSSADSIVSPAPELRKYSIMQSLLKIQTRFLSRRFLENINLTFAVIRWFDTIKKSIRSLQILTKSSEIHGIGENLAVSR